MRREGRWRYSEVWKGFYSDVVGCCRVERNQGVIIGFVFPWRHAKDKAYIDIVYINIVYIDTV